MAATCPDGAARDRSEAVSAHIIGVASPRRGDDFGCPKSMTYGPCGDVHDDGSCEVSPHRCTFLEGPIRNWSGDDATTTTGTRGLARRTPEGEALLALMAERPILVSDFPIRDATRAAHEAGANAMAGSVDAALIGEPPSVRRQLPPAYRTRVLREAGVAVWTSVNCRDRNRVALEGELAGLVDAGASAVHAITGGHPLTGRRADAQPVFDIESTELTALAARTGLVVSVAESPESEPRRLRPGRFAQKAAAGAEIAFLNMTSGPDVVDGFLRTVDTLDASRPAMVCIPLVIDEGSARIMTGLGTHAVPSGYVEGILDASDPRRRGIRAAARLSEAYLGISGVAGVCLSGGATAGRELEYAEAMAEAAAAIGLRS